MKLLKNKIIVYLVFFLLVSIILVILLNRNNVVLDNISLEKNLGNFTNYESNVDMTEGKKIWDITNLTKDSFAKLVKDKNIYGDFIMVFIDSVECEACLNFAIENLLQLKDKDIKIVGYTHSYNYFIKKAVNFITKDTSTINFIKNYFPKKFIVAFVDVQGRIIYVDFPTPSTIIQSKTFYYVIRKYSE